MKIKIFVVSLILAFTTGFTYAQDGSNLTPGMDMSAFKKACPKAEKGKRAMSDVYLLDEEIWGVDGTWQYRFESGLLESYLWRSNTSDINQSNYDLYLKVSRQLIGRLRKIYGNTTEFEETNVDITDHQLLPQGYKVVNALWSTEKVKLQVSFEYRMTEEGSSTFELIQRYSKP